VVSLAVGVVDQQTAVLAAVLAAGGLFLIIGGALGYIRLPHPKSASVDQATGVGIRTGLAFGVSVVLYMLTGWIVVALFGAIAGWFTLTLKNAKRERHAAIDRVDAIATWVENLRDNIAGSAGLQQALRMSGDHAPEPIRSEVRDLVLRLQHEPVTTSLRRFAADVAHPTSDMVVGCRVLASSRSAGSLAPVLAKTAQAARDSASMMRQIDAGRRASQSQAKLVAIVTGLMSLTMATGDGDFVAPYDTLGGQATLAVICSIYTGAAVMLYRLAKPMEQQRVFRGVEVDATPTPDKVESDVHSSAGVDQ